MIVPSLLEPYEVPKALEAIPEDIPVISVSRVNSFLTCPYRYYLQYEVNLSRESDGDAAELGLLIHDLFRVYYEAIYKRNPDPRARVMERLEQFKAAFTTYDQMRQVGLAGKLTLKYVDTVAKTLDRGLFIQGVERHFVVRFTTPKGNPYFLQGYIDLLGSYGKGSIIIDHKSGGNKFWTSAQVQFDSQLRSYAVALRELGYNPTQGAINNINTFEYKSEQSPEKYFKRTSTTYSSVELDAFLHNLGLIVDEMYYTPELPIRRNIGKHCSGCWVQKPCLYDMKGIETIALLRSKGFKRRGYELVQKDLILGLDRPALTE